ncbi:uncharacterized [Tachysurus ichikawai]
MATRCLNTTGILSLFQQNGAGEEPLVNSSREANSRHAQAERTRVSSRAQTQTPRRNNTDLTMFFCSLSCEERPTPLGLTPTQT